MKKYTLQKKPFVVPTTDGKRIEEHHGLVSTNNPEISIAHMIAPAGWSANLFKLQSLKNTPI